ncbi:MAG: hypothetical protein L0226_03155 [Acidobacteria bacterium]|nr:hypothetical protein [Acidobacteriota bacterium]
MDTVVVDSKADWQSLWFRSLGWLPLIFFIARLVAYVQLDQPSQMLWMCHLANLVLAAGLFLANPLIIRTAVVLLVFGIPPWAIDMLLTGLITPVSIASHLGGMIVGLLAIAKVRAKSWTWLMALASFVFVQIICRFVTPPALNVNTAHRVYDIWKDTVSSYWQYWLISTLVIGVSLWAIDWVLGKLFPPTAQR